MRPTSFVTFVMVALSLSASAQSSTLFAQRETRASTEAVQLFQAHPSVRAALDQYLHDGGLHLAWRIETPQVLLLKENCGPPGCVFELLVVQGVSACFRPLPRRKIITP